MTTRFFRILFLLIFACITSIAYALEFIVDGKFNSTVSKGYRVQIGDTLAGYPIFANDGDWRIYYSNMGESTQGILGRLRVPTIGLERYDENGKWVMAQILTVNLSLSGHEASGWKGEPCGGEKIIKINIIRSGSVDRCATSEIKSLKLNGVDTEVLSVAFTETNTQSRIYRAIFNTHFQQLGLTRSEVMDKSSAFNLRLKDWMDKFLTATVKAASFDKPPEAFKDVQTFAEVTRTGRVAINNKPSPPNAEELPQENERKAKELFEERLRVAQERQRLDAEKLQLQQAQQREQEEKLVIAQSAVVPTQSGKRIALVVGNSKYNARPLKNPINDADDISKALKSSNFEVIDLRNATLPQMRTAVRQFGDRLLQNDVGLVYYSGHGVEVKGRNYFIPVNADIQREDEIADQGLDVSLILEKMSTAGKGVNILIVDACRDDPFGRSFRSSSRGLAQMEAPRGTIIAYATSPGKVASDGDSKERNSPYTKHLVKAMQAPNKPIEQVFKEVRRGVQDETKNQQTPWENTSLSGDFYFRVQK